MPGRTGVRAVFLRTEKLNSLKLGPRGELRSIVPKCRVPGMQSASLPPLTATGDVGIGNPFPAGGGRRGIQLAAKFTF
jgi:hypothetical protein